MAETSISTSNSSMIEHLNSERRSKETMEDRISSLPDEVLTHILSYIPTKSSVATSVLSKRWNQLWIAVPNLDFGDYTRLLLGHPEKSDIFVNFVDRVLSLNTVLSVRQIRIPYHGVLEVSKYDAWVSSIAKRGAEEIDLCLYPCTYLPDSFFNRKILVELKLSMIPAKIPKSVCFPTLKTIHLYSDHLLDNDSIKNLLSGCPLLRNLYLEIYFFGARYNKVDVSSLVKLYLCFETNNEMSFGILTNLPMFHNLTHLTLDITDMDLWESVPRLLHSTPNLVTFILLSTNIPCCWDDPSVVPHCLLSSLESVEISIYFEEHGQEETMMMISYILKNANVLKKFSIHTCGKPAEENEFVKTLLNLPRSSVACQVHYDYEWMEQHNDFLLVFTGSLSMHCFPYSK